VAAEPSVTARCLPSKLNTALTTDKLREMKARLVTLRRPCDAIERPVEVSQWLALHAV
jgi:hypothetical protein